MTSCSGSPRDPSPPHSYEHLAPAGTKFKTILDAGSKWLNEYCFGFPNGVESIIHPQVFQSKYPEGHGSNADIAENSRGLDEKEKKLLIGMRNNQRGEIGEYKAWLLFHKLTTETNFWAQTLVLKTFNLDCDSKKNVRKKALENELKPKCNVSFSSIAKSAEHDMIVLIKDLGMVMVEVKTSKIGNAEDQLHNGVAFFSTLMFAVSTTKSLYPIARVVIMPFNDEPSPTTTTSHGTHVLHKDIIEDFARFERKWSEIVSEMANAFSDSQLKNDDFKNFSAYVVGLWSMMPLRIDGLVTHCFDKRNFTTSSQLEQVCKMVDEAHLSSCEGIFKGIKKKKLGEKIKANPVSNVIRANDHFNSAADMNLLYITPEQKRLYEQYRQVMIRGASGVGKSILMYFKILDIMNDPNETNKSILVVVPHPSQHRFDNILKSNNVNTIIVTELPPTPPPNTVIIMEMNYFRPVISLSNLDVALYHTFMDDFQSLFRPEEPDIDDRIDFINSCYRICQRSALYLWIAVDPRQETNSLHSLGLFGFEEDEPYSLNSLGLFGLKGEEPNPFHLFRSFEYEDEELGPSTSNPIQRNLHSLRIGYALTIVEKEERCSFWKPDDTSDLNLSFEAQHRPPTHSAPKTFKLVIPVFQLTQILRNSVDVANSVMERRNEMDEIIKEIRKEEGRIREHTSYETLTKMKRGLLKGISIGHHITSCPVKDYSTSENVDIVALARNEVEMLLKTISPSQIAILYDISMADEYAATIQTMLLESFNIKTQTIEESLLAKSNDAIIFDEVENVASFEIPCGIVITRKYRYHTYTLVSRFRAKLVFITPEDEWNRDINPRISEITYVVHTEFKKPISWEDSDKIPVFSYSIFPYQWEDGMLADNVQSVLPEYLSLRENIRSEESNGAHHSDT